MLSRKQEWLDSETEQFFKGLPDPQDGFWAGVFFCIKPFHNTLLFSHDGVQKLCTDCIIDFLTWDVLQETFSCSVQHLSVANALCIGVIFLLQCSTAFRGLLWKYGC